MIKKRFAPHAPLRTRRARVHTPARTTQTTQNKERVWLFDLDNTLHDTSHKIFREINRGMTAAVMESLAVDEATANQLRTTYWKRYGATMIGLVRNHGVDPHQFLHRSHDFDVRPLVKAESGLAQKLRRLPGRKILVTNAPVHYARAVMKHLKILHCFDGFWGIEHMQLHGHFRPKPSVSLMRYILAHEGIHPSRAVLVEDTTANLRGARQAGLRTVHVFHPGTPFAKGKRGRPNYIDLRVNCVGDLLLQKRALQGM